MNFGTIRTKMNRQELIEEELEEFIQNKNDKGSQKTTNLLQVRQQTFASE